MRIRGIDLHVEDSGSGPPVLFSHGLLWSGRMYGPQIAALRDRYRCVAYDHRGQGQSEVPPETIVSIEDCYLDAVALIEELRLAPCHFVGLSMGGFVAMRLAARRPELLASVSLLATAADAEPKENLPKYRLLNAIARLGGMRLAAAEVAPIMFGETFLGDPARSAERTRLVDELRLLDRQIYRAVEGVLTRRGVEHELARIAIPTLVMRGDEDRAIARHRVEALRAGIPHARWAPIAGAGHTMTLEQPQDVTRVLAAFLDAQPRPSRGPRRGA